MGIEIKEFVGHNPKQIREESEKQIIKNNKKSTGKKVPKESAQKNGD